MLTVRLSTLMVIPAILLSACSDASPPPFEPATHNPVITPFLGVWVSGPAVFSGGDHALIRELRFSRGGGFEWTSQHFHGCRGAGDALECDTLLNTHAVTGTFAVEDDRCDFSVEASDLAPTVEFFADCSFELRESGLLFRFEGLLPGGGTGPREEFYRRGSWKVDG